MSTLRWPLLFTAAACAAVIASTGIWNGVALLAVIFLAGYAITFREVRELLAILIGAHTLVSDDPDPRPSRLDLLDGGEDDDCPGCPSCHIQDADEPVGT